MCYIVWKTFCMKINLNIRKFFQSFKKIPLPNRWLTAACVILLICILIPLSSGTNNNIKDLYFLFRSNIPLLLCALITLTALYVWVKNRRILTETALLESKVVVILLLATNLFLLFYRGNTNLAPMEKQKLQSEYRQKIDSIKTDHQEILERAIGSSKKEAERALKTSEEKVKTLEADLVTLKQGRDSALVANTTKEDVSVQTPSSGVNWFSGKGKMPITVLLIVLAFIFWFSLKGRDRPRYITTGSMAVLSVLIFVWVVFFPDLLISKSGKEKITAKKESVKKKEALVPAPTPQPVDTTTVVATVPEEKKQDSVATPSVEFEKPVTEKKKWRKYKPPPDLKKRWMKYKPPPKNC